MRDLDVAALEYAGERVRSHWRALDRAIEGDRAALRAIQESTSHSEAIRIAESRLRALTTEIPDVPSACVPALLGRVSALVDEDEDPGHVDRTLAR